MSTQVAKNELIKNFDTFFSQAEFRKHLKSSDFDHQLLVATVQSTLTTLTLTDQNPRGRAELANLEKQFFSFMEQPTTKELDGLFSRLYQLGSYLKRGDKFRCGFLRLILQYSVKVHPDTDANNIIREQLLSMLRSQHFSADKDLPIMIQFMIKWNRLITNRASTQAEYDALYKQALYDFEDTPKLWGGLLEKYRDAYVLDLDSNRALLFETKVAKLRTQGNPFLTTAVNMMAAEFFHPANTAETQNQLSEDLTTVGLRCRPNAKPETIEKFNEIVSGYVGYNSQFLRGAGIALAVLGLAIMSATLAIVAWHVLPLAALPLFVAQHILQLSAATFAGGATMTMGGALLYHQNYVDEKGRCMQELQQDIQKPAQGRKNGH